MLLAKGKVTNTLTELLSALGINLLDQKLDFIKPGLPILGEDIVSKLEKLSDAKLMSYGLFWKSCGQSGHVQVNHLEIEAIRAYDIHSLIPEASPRVHAVTKNKFGMYGYLMEFMDGYKLCDVLKGKRNGDGTITFAYYDAKASENRQIKMNADGLFKIKRGLTDAVYRLKNARVYHGDLWPPNVMVTSADLQVKLIDPWFEATIYELPKCVRNDYGSLELMNKELDALIGENKNGTSQKHLHRL